MYSGKGPVTMVRDFLSDRKLQVQGIIMTEIGQPLEDAYAADLKAQCPDKRSDLLNWCANRALGGEESWWTTVTQILLKPHQPALFQRLHLPGPTTTPVRIDEPWLSQDRDTTNWIYEFAWTLSANLVWSEILFKWTFPLGTAVLASTDPEIRKHGMAAYSVVVVGGVK